MTILVLAGTSEAKRLCSTLAKENLVVIASLAGVTRNPADLGVKTRIGGFGGVKGLKKFIETNEISVVVDATHPFAIQMSNTAFSVCKQSNIPHCILQRKGWVPTDRDRWHQIDRIEEAAQIIPRDARVFVGTGRQTISDLVHLKGREMFMRVIDPTRDPFPYSKGRFLIGRPPFSIGDEIQLFESRRIDWLLVKNSGGEASFSKLAAARELGLSVAMLTRPDLPIGACIFETVSDAFNWITS